MISGCESVCLLDGVGDAFMFCSVVYVSISCGNIPTHSNSNNCLFHV